MPEVIQVAVVGPSGSGKTWLARGITTALGDQAAYISLDDFYRDLSHLAPEERSATNFDHPAAIDWDAVRLVLDALGSGKTAQIPEYDFATHTRRLARQPVEPRPFVVWDGLWLLHESWLRQRFGFSTFVDCLVSERLTRRVARDVLERGRTAESVRRQFLEQVEPMCGQFIEPQRQWATSRVSSPITEEDFKELLGRISGLTAKPRNQLP